MDRNTRRPALDREPQNEPHAESRIHPLVYRIIVGLAAVLVFGIVGFSGGSQKYNGLVLTVASLFVLVSVGIAAIMWRIWMRDRVAEGRPGKFRNWLASEVEVWQGHLKGSDAAAAILLPIVAVSIGMMIFAIELQLVAHGTPH